MSAALRVPSEDDASEVARLVSEGAPGERRYRETFRYAGFAIYAKDAA